MAKGVRSKAYRMHRTEFRKTVGQDAADAAMALTQAKLALCVGDADKKKGGLSRLAKALGDDDEEDEEMEDVSDDEDETPVNPLDLKVAERASNVRLTKKHARPLMSGQPGAKRARLLTSKSNKRGTTKKGYSTRKGGTVKKRGAGKSVGKI
jgi:hypothetical protein